MSSVSQSENRPASPNPAQGVKFSYKYWIWLISICILCKRWVKHCNASASAPVPATPPLLPLSVTNSGKIKIISSKYTLHWCCSPFPLKVSSTVVHRSNIELWLFFLSLHLYSLDSHGHFKWKLACSGSISRILATSNMQKHCNPATIGLLYKKYSGTDNKLRKLTCQVSSLQFKFETWAANLDIIYLNYLGVKII